MSYQKFYSNQIHSSSLLCQLSQMWKNQILCDAIIRTGTVITKAHRLVLIAACPMLQSMENAAAGSHLEVKLAADIKQDSVNTFLQYLYEGFMMLTEDNIREVEKVARLLQVDGVIKCCADFYKCLHKKGIAIQPGGQYKYSFQDLVEFRHVRASEVIKSTQERVTKRSSEFSRSGSPGGKRQRFHRPGSPSNDSKSMSDSYRASHSSDPWDRVPRLGLGGTSYHGATGRQQPGVVEIVEDSIEIIQSDSTDPNRPHEIRQGSQKSVAISIASQITDNADLRVVNISGSDSRRSNQSVFPGMWSGPSASGTSTVNSSRGPGPSQSLSEQSSISSPITSNSSDMSGPSARTEYQRSSDLILSNTNLSRANVEFVPKPKMPESPSVPFPVSLSPVGGAPSKPFAVGSAGQTQPPGSSSQHALGSPIGGLAASPFNRGPRSQSSQGRSDSVDTTSSSADLKGDISVKDTGYSNDVSSEIVPPDLSIVKVEARHKDDADSLAMYVDSSGDGTMRIHTRGHEGEGGGEVIEGELDEALEEWAQEDMEGDHSMDQMSMGPDDFKEKTMHVRWSKEAAERNKDVYPKPGVYDQQTAAAYNMVELEYGSGVYVHDGHIFTALEIGYEPDFEGRSGAKMARYLLGQFWTTRELIGATLSEASLCLDKRLLDTRITEAIIESAEFPRPGRHNRIRPGIFQPEEATSFGMMELAQGSAVYLYPGQVQMALAVGVEPDKPLRNGEKMARFLLSQFYTAKELVGKTLAAGNPSKEQVNPYIVEAITKHGRPYENRGFPSDDLCVVQAPGGWLQKDFAYSPDRHTLVPIGCKRNCGYCDIVGKKYPSGVAVRTYYQCAGCGVALCRHNQSDCFDRFHEFLIQHPDIPPQLLVKELKKSFRESDSKFAVVDKKFDPVSYIKDSDVTFIKETGQSFFKPDASLTRHTSKSEDEEEVHELN